MFETLRQELEKTRRTGIRQEFVNIHEVYEILDRLEQV